MTDDSGNGYYLNLDGNYDKLHRTAWARRTSGMMAGATLGAVYGAVIGAAAAFIPYLVGVMGLAGGTAIGLPGVAAIASSIALFSAVAAGVGMLVTSDVAMSAATAPAIIEERDVSGKPAPGRVPEKNTGEEKGPPLFSWKVAAVTAPLFAAFGALIALNPHTSAVVLNQGAFPELAGNLGASVAASAITFGLFGSLLGMKSSDLSNRLTNFYYKLLTEQNIDREPHKDRVKQLVQQMETMRSDRLEINNVAPRKGSFTDERLRFSLKPEEQAVGIEGFRR